MKISAIDVGSNSVRLAVVADGKTLYKRIITTRLAENLAKTGVLSDAAIERTALAILRLKEVAESENSTRIHIFATAAVRSAKNREVFLDRTQKLCGLNVDVIGGDEEAKLGILGALGGADGGIIDVGGASTEVTVQRGGKRLYSHSANVGTVRLNDLAGRNFAKLMAAALEIIDEYGDFDASAFDMYAIGGTATTLAAVKHGLKVYNPSVTDGTQLFLDEVLEMADKFVNLPVEEVRRISGMEPNRADIIGGGCLLTYLIMRRFGVNKITVSEKDNLEGYIKLKEGWQ